jgi:GntR family transcriptional repressor for pyruvate dehydrogenase complex
VLKHANRSTLYDDIMFQMVNAIRDGHWASGSRLPGEQLLAGTFGVSRACIREVLKALTYTGVLEAHPGHGTFVSKNASKILNGTQLMEGMLSDSFSYSELMEIRRLLEGQAAYWAAERSDAEDIERLEHILRGEERGEPLYDIHDAFHNAIIDMAGNRMLVKLLSFLRVDIWTQRKFHSGILPDGDRREHWNVLNAIKTGSPAKARKAMLQHVDFFWKKQRHDQEDQES